VSTTTSQYLIATSTLHGNIVVWDVETHLKVCCLVFIAAVGCLQFKCANTIEYSMDISVSLFMLIVIS